MTLPSPLGAALFVDGELVNEAKLYARVFTPINSIIAWANALGTYAAWTPALTSSGTTPTLGAASNVVGRVTQVGKIVTAYARITFGTSGTNAGTGTYVVAPPVTPETTLNGNHVIGYGSIKCAGNTTRVLIYSDSIMRYTSTAVGGASTTVTATAPGAWTANDSIELVLNYEAA